MRSRNRIRHAILLLWCCLGFGCASTHAPSNWLASPTDAQLEVHGGWLELEYTSVSKGKTRLAGELIAIGQDSIFIANEAFHVVALSGIKSARLVAYQSGAGGMGGLVSLGTLSTLSNGAFLLFTAPMWIIGGSIATGTRSFEPIVDYPKRDWSHFAPFARYPQGMPMGIDRKQIKMKPRK